MDCLLNIIVLHNSNIYNTFGILEYTLYTKVDVEIINMPVYIDNVIH